MEKVNWTERMTNEVLNRVKRGKNINVMRLMNGTHITYELPTTENNDGKAEANRGTGEKGLGS